MCFFFLYLSWVDGVLVAATDFAKESIGLGPPTIPGPTYNRWVAEASAARERARIDNGEQTPGSALRALAPPDPHGCFLCQYPSCTRVFSSRRHLARHYQCSGHGPIPPVVKKRKKRCNYTFTRKRDLILELDDLEKRTDIVDPLQHLSDSTGVPVSNLSKWRSQRSRIFLLATTRGKAKLRKFRPVLAEFPNAEVDLYIQFCYRRNCLRLPVHRWWLCEKFAATLQRLYGLDRNPSEGWCSSFCKRWEITSQCRTNKHKESITERLPRIRKFHQMLIYGVQRSEPQRDPKYGRFPARCMYHMDQVPLAFSPGTGRSLNQKGKPCAVVDPDGSGASKRFCTLQVTICADPANQRVKLEVYFRGRGLRLSKEEKEFYETLGNINVRFQQKAWADERIMTKYIMDFRESTLDQGKVMLGMDGHGSQITPLCRMMYRHLGIFEIITPPNCTDCISPVDKNVGQALKQKIARKYEKEYRGRHEECMSLWGPGCDYGDDDVDCPESSGRLSGVARKRMLVARWASEAWTELCTENQGLLQAAFVKTGFLIAKDGSENHLIQLWKKGRSQYRATDEFGNPYTF